MFAGIIRNQGIFIHRKPAGNHWRFSFEFKNPEEPLHIGESIAVDGVCLTVVRKHTDGFECDVVSETLKSTTLGRLKPASSVNLERSLRYGDRISGHFVSGHVDGRAKIEKIQKQGEDYLFYLRVPGHLVRFLAPKGSVALDGISLTVQDIRRQTIKVAVIPHTFRVTALSRKKTGDEINLEVDMMARYPGSGGMPRKKENPEKLTLSYLIQQGF